MRFEFKELGLMSVVEFREFFVKVCRRLSLGERVFEETENCEVSLESPDGSVRGYFNSDHANGELTVEREVTVVLAADIEGFLRMKGQRPVVRVRVD